MSAIAGASASSSCPPGMALIGAPNSNGTYCIDTTTHTPDNWYNAMVTCSSSSTTGWGFEHLCSAVEFTAACTNAKGLTAIGTEWELSSDFYVGGGGGDANFKHFYDMGKGSCTALDTDIGNGSKKYPFRCCISASGATGPTPPPYIPPPAPTPKGGTGDK